MKGSATDKTRPVVLVFPFDLMAHYVRSIAFARHFSSEFEFVFEASERYQAHVESAGFSSFPCERFEASEVMACARRFDFSWLNPGSIKRVFEAQVAAIEVHKPAFVVGDVSPTLRMAAEATGVKYVTITNGYMCRSYMYTRRLSYRHPASALMDKLPRPVAGGIIRMAEGLAFRNIHRPFRELRKKRGLKHVAGYLAEMEGDLNLICDHPGLFPQKQLAHNYMYIGPLHYKAAALAEPLDRKPTAGKKTVMVCMGSSGDWEKLAELGTPAFADLNIITAGDRDRVVTGSHVSACSFLDLDAVLPSCDVMICHGGNGTAYFGLRHGLFMLCLTDHFEQEWNVHRLEELGFGLHLNLSTRTLREEVEAAMNRRYTPVRWDKDHVDYPDRVRELLRTLAAEFA